MTQLTNEQKKVFSLLNTSLKALPNALNGLQTSLLDSDPALSGYLPSTVLIAIFRKNGVRDSITEQQFNIVFSAIDKNSKGDSSYKQLLELLIGADET